MKDDLEPILTDRTPTLEQLSLDELQVRIEALQSQIKACESEIERKKAQKQAADALFGGDS